MRRQFQIPRVCPDRAFTAAIPLVLMAAAIAQNQPESRHPTREHQPPALKDDDEMQKPGIRSDGAIGEPRRDAGETLSEPMRLRCRMLMRMKVEPFAPASVLALEEELQLSEEQADRLRDIHGQAVARSRTVLDDRQKAILAELDETPDTVMSMHRRMMGRQAERQHGTAETDTRMDGRSARRAGERPEDHCPMMRAMGEAGEGAAEADDAVSEGHGIQQTVDVVLRDFEIDMPETLGEGIVRFRVRNAGKMPHSFEIKGQGIEESFATRLEPGETRTLHAQLRSGEYTAHCPVNGHSKRGMRMKLNVTVAGRGE